MNQQFKIKNNKFQRKHKIDKCFYKKFRQWQNSKKLRKFQKTIHANYRQNKNEKIEKII